ncbi:hypothetical protein VTN02DRAFT_2574 [Thermoascus thermophilus]
MRGESVGSRLSPDGPGQASRSLVSLHPADAVENEYSVLHPAVGCLLRIPPFGTHPVWQLMRGEHVDKDITVSRELAELGPDCGLNGLFKGECFPPKLPGISRNPLQSLCRSTLAPIPRLNTPYHMAQNAANGSRSEPEYLCSQRCTQLRDERGVQPSSYLI